MHWSALKVHIYTTCTTIVPSNIYHHGPQKSRKFHDVYVGLVIVKFCLDFQQQKGFFLQKLMRFRKEEIKKHRQKLYFYGFFDSILRSSSKYLIAISISIYFSRWAAHRINKSIKITACYFTQLVESGQPTKHPQSRRYWWR